MDPGNTARARDYDVFISHRQADSEVASALAEQLRRRGHRVFFDADSLIPGTQIQTSLREAIANAAAVLVLVSPEYAASGWTRYELELALPRAGSGEALLIPVWLPGVDPAMQPRLARFRGVFLAGQEDISGAVEIIDRSLSEWDRPSTEDQLESAELLERSFADNLRVLGPDNSSTLATQANLANVYLQLGRTNEAAALLQESWAARQRVLGPDHPSTLSTRANLANVYLQLGRTDEAAALLQESLAASQRVLGPEHPSTLATSVNLAGVLFMLGRTLEAADLLERSLAASIRVLGSDHPDTLLMQVNLANVYVKLGRTAEAADLLERSLATSRRVLGVDHPSTLATQVELGNVYPLLGRTAEAADLTKRTSRLADRAGDPQ